VSKIDCERSLTPSRAGVPATPASRPCDTSRRRVLSTCACTNVP
jgi:hypothetical protein